MADYLGFPAADFAKSLDFYRLALAAIGFDCHGKSRPLKPAPLSQRALAGCAASKASRQLFF
jgi:hypothetical protein